MLLSLFPFSLFNSISSSTDLHKFTMGSPSSQINAYHLSFKVLLIGDSGVGKSSLLHTFISASLHDLTPTIGVDFKIKQLTIGGKRLKLTIWDTAGQERFRSLTSSYYRGTQGIILVYDVTRRETFTNLLDVWANEVELYLTDQDCVKMLVGNKVDRESERAVSREDGIALANKLGSLFLECSAKTRENVEKCFEELAVKIMEVPSFLEERSTMLKRNILRQKQESQAQHSGGCCS
ncbi:ras-related protein RABC2a-like isoform X2 [Benincasa hispida]|uniref:ras-related protein RABC2a-like isoform X2 n=1 Tax=Benincasa hispida TaxID=102211 RepID=UPI0018FF595B|nr:ras-related protein RABC2a-like isoform X2 [Benincasa hispida]